MPSNLIDPTGIEHLRQLDGLVVAGELNRHVTGVKAHIPIATGRKPVGLTGADNYDAATPLADPLHFRQARVAAMPWVEGEGGARDHDVSVGVRHRQVIKEAMLYLGAVATIRCASF